MYQYAVTLQGHTPSDRSTMRFDLGTPTDYAAALNAANQIRGALVDITGAFVAKEVISVTVSEDGTRPAEGVNTFEEAAVQVYLNDPADAVKLATIRIPAAVPGIYLVDGETVDIGDADLIQYVEQLSQHAFVSDGEQIVTTVQDGIASGFKRTRSKRFK